MCELFNHEPERDLALSTFVKALRWFGTFVWRRLNQIDVICIAVQLHSCRANREGAGPYEVHKLPSAFFTKLCRSTRRSSSAHLYATH